MPLWNGLSGGNSNNRHKFNGQEVAPELGPGLHDFGARFYDAAIGRMQSVDRAAMLFAPVNGYNFGLNNPIGNIDPTGDTTVPAGPGDLLSKEQWSNFRPAEDAVGLNEAVVKTSRNREESSGSGGGGGGTGGGWGDLGGNVGQRVMPERQGFFDRFDQFWNGNRSFMGRQVDEEGILTPYSTPITGTPPDIGPAGKVGSTLRVGRSLRNVLGSYSWSSGQLARTAKEILRGKTTINVAIRSEAEELFLGLFQGKGFRNTTGMSAAEAKAFLGKSGTYHWDDAVDATGRMVNHSAKNAHGAMKHLQVHDETGTIFRIFFER